jgi:hypothetical protein
MGLDARRAEGPRPNLPANRPIVRALRERRLSLGALCRWPDPQRRSIAFPAFGGFHGPTPRLSTPTTLRPFRGKRKLHGRELVPSSWAARLHLAGRFKTDPAERMQSSRGACTLVEQVQDGGRRRNRRPPDTRYRTWMSPLVTSPDAEYPAAVWITRVSAGLEPGGPLSSTAIR